MNWCWNQFMYGLSDWRAAAVGLIIGIVILLYMQRTLDKP